MAQPAGASPQLAQATSQSNGAQGQTHPLQTSALCASICTQRCCTPDVYPNVLRAIFHESTPGCLPAVIPHRSKALSALPLYAPFQAVRGPSTGGKRATASRLRCNTVAHNRHNTYTAAATHLLLKFRREWRHRAGGLPRGLF